MLLDHAQEPIRPHPPALTDDSPDPNPQADAPGFRAAYEAAYRAFEGLCLDLHAAVAAALRLPPDFFDAALRRHVTNLCALHYPARRAPAAARAEAAEASSGVEADNGGAEAAAGAAAAAGEAGEGVVRVRPHTDPTSLTARSS